ncbi:alpha/beta-hydrolase family protein [Cryptosporangium minutisporangium]|uniref:Alpha/beta-hydrolase catalytic domain-containing protein n=1 Tax=Cryptosporangium minutisporangium TaxID=113569 RepID=A0ABP6STU8_9ACTN
MRPPIRVYVGLDTAPTSRERAALAVRELQRTGAFHRETLCLVTTTGTGWVNPQAVDPLEYMYRGDTALAAMQYSYLPSPISFLTDEERAREAARDLFDQVYAVWSRLPRTERPKLLVFGESFGTLPTAAWAEIAPPPGWTPERTAALMQLLTVPDD